jgi:Transposase and inactivated derivatives
MLNHGCDMHSEIKAILIVLLFTLIRALSTYLNRILTSQVKTSCGLTVLKVGPFDNDPMEAFNAILKKEVVYLLVYHDFDSAKLKLFDYIDGFYNRNRIHGSIDFMSPIAFELLAPNP